MSVDTSIPGAPTEAVCGVAKASKGQCESCIRYSACLRVVDGVEMCIECSDLWKRGYEAALLDAMIEGLDDSGFQPSDTSPTPSEVATEAAAWDGMRR